MTKKVLCFIALFLMASGLPLLAQTQPIRTGDFQSGTATVTLVLLNQSHVPDSTLANVANSLTGKTYGIVVATRLAGIGSCGQGEWCLPITDQIASSGTDAAIGAAVGSEVIKEIFRKMLSTLTLQM